MDINRSSQISNSLFINSLTEVMVRFQESKVQFNPFQATGFMQSESRIPLNREKR